MNDYDNNGKVRILPGDTVTEHPDVNGNKTLLIARTVNDKLMCCTIRPDGTPITLWTEVRKFTRL